MQSELVDGGTQGGRPSAGGNRRRLDRALVEHLTSLTHHDLSAVTVEAVAQVAGVSRATAYRHLGSRDELLYRAAVGLARDHKARCGEILARTATVAARVEESFAYTVRETSTDVMLQLLLRSPRADAIDDAVREMAAQLMGPALHLGQQDGQIRNDVPAAELVAWLVEQQYVVDRMDLDDDAVRRWVRRFVLPALRPQQDSDRGLQAQARAALVEVRARTEALLHAVDMASAAVSGTPVGPPPQA